MFFSLPIHVTPSHLRGRVPVPHDRGMNLDFLGAEQNFTVLAGSQPTYRLDFMDDSGNALVLDNVTFDGLLTAPDGTERALDISQGESGNTLMVVFPTVETGMYLYELRATSEGGDRLRLAYGRLGVMGTNLELARVEDEIEKLLNTLTGANAVLLSYANSKIEELDTRRQALTKEIAALSAETMSPEQIERLSVYLNQWEEIDFEDRRQVADGLISQIRATDEHVSIEWKI